MTYKIIPTDQTVLVKISENGRTEDLSMSDVPCTGSLLVTKSKKDVLGELNLEKMLIHLDNCVDLLQIAYNAVWGFEVIHADVSNLTTGFLDAMQKSNSAALEFKLTCDNVIQNYLFAYGLLFEGNVGMAIELLTDCKGKAVQMEKEAQNLIDVYKGLTTDANTVLTDVTRVYTSDETKRDKMIAAISEIEGSVKAMNVLKENLKSDIENYDREYKELVKRELKQEERAYNLQLTSIIIGEVVGGAGTVIDALTGNRKSERDQLEKQIGTELTAETKVLRDYNGNLAKQAQNKSNIAKIDARVAAIDKILDEKLYKNGENNASADTSDPDTQKTAQGLREERTKKSEEKEKLNNEITKLKGEENALTGELKALGVAMDKVADEAKKNAQDLQKVADSLAERAEAIREKRDKLKDQERENLVKLAKSTAEMEHMVIEKNSLGSAIQCLVTAIGCLRIVLANLEDIKLFWMNVRAFCDSLAKNETINNLVSHNSSESPEKCAVLFKKDFFVKGYIGVVAKWKALYDIFTEYLVTLSKVSKRMSATLEQSLSSDRKVQWDNAAKLAGELNKSIREEIKII